MSGTGQIKRGAGRRALVLVGGANPVEPLHWALVDPATGAVLEEGVTEDGARPPPAPPARTVLVLPGADAQVKALELQAHSEVQAARAAALMFEGAIVASEGVHYAVGRAMDADGRRLVAAISAPRLAAWLERCAGLGASPARVTLDFLAWPTAPGEIEIVETPGTVIVAGGPRGGFAIEPALAPALFQRWLAQAGGQGAPVRLTGGDPDAWAERLGAASTLRAGEPGALMARLAAGAVRPPAYAPNLRQGAFGTRAGGGGRFSLWGLAAALAVLAVLLQAGALAVEGWRAQRDADQTLAAAEQAFRAARPDIGRIVDLRAQVTAAQNAARGSAAHPVLRANEPLAEAIAEPARLDSLAHDGAGRTLRLVLTAPDQPPLDAVTAALRAKGLTVQARALPPIEGRYASELMVESPP